MKPYPKLTTSLFDVFSNRKAAGTLSLLIDTERSLVYIMPPDKEHADVIAELLGIEKKELSQHFETMEKYVPATVQTTAETITGVIIGVSGIEIGFRVLHTKEQLEKARIITWKFLQQGDIPIAKTIEYDTIIRKYQKK